MEKTKPAQSPPRIIDRLTLHCRIYHALRREQLSTPRDLWDQLKFRRPQLELYEVELALAELSRIGLVHIARITPEKENQYHTTEET